MPAAASAIFYTTGSLGPEANQLRRVGTDGSGDTQVLGEADGLERPEGVIVDGAGGHVYVANMGRTGGIVRASTDGSDVETLVAVDSYGGFAPQGIELYREGGRSTVFWADPDPDVHAVMAADATTGEHVARHVESRTSHVADVSLDSVHRRLYFADMLNHEVGVVGLDGELAQAVVSNIMQPVGVAVDGWSGHLFFSTVAEGGGTIYRTDLQGMGLRILQSHPTQWWGFLAVDPRTQQLYASEVHGRIVRMGYDGRGVEVVVQAPSNSSFAGLGLM